MRKSGIEHGSCSWHLDRPHDSPLPALLIIHSGSLPFVDFLLGFGSISPVLLYPLVAAAEGPCLALPLPPLRAVPVFPS